MIKEGLVLEYGELVFYRKGRPYHAGIIKHNGDIYYIGKRGRAVKGMHVVHGEMTNGIVKRGTYTFDDDCRMIPGSYIAPKKRRKKRNIFRKWKKWVPATCLVLMLLLAFLVGSRMERGSVISDEVVESQEVSTATGQFHLPVFDKPVLLCSDAAKQMYEGQMTVEDCVDAGVAYRALEFSYDLVDTEGVLLISEEEDPSVARSFSLQPQYTSILIDNLKTDTAYRYRVSAGGKDYEGGFVTDKSTRFISMPGVVNTRDIGGYLTQDGKTVKQGLLIRGSEIDGFVVPSYFLETEAVEDIQQTFGFVHDFDLRGGNIYSGVYQSRLGADVTHKFYGAPQYGEIFNRSYQPALREIFTDLADPSKYPMYLHCTHGADRTGTIVFLLQGILNMSEEDMIKEYRMTGFTTAAYRKSLQMDIVINGLQAYDGLTLQEKIVSFLTQTVGITQEQIQSIRDIFLQ